jgi:hypothetical protein
MRIGSGFTGGDRSGRGSIGRGAGRGGELQATTTTIKIDERTALA